MCVVARCLLGMFAAGAKLRSLLYLHCAAVYDGIVARIRHIRAYIFIHTPSIYIRAFTNALVHKRAFKLDMQELKTSEQ